MEVKSLDVTATPAANSTGISFDITSIPNYQNLVLWENLFPLYLSGIDRGSTEGNGTISGNTAQTIMNAYNASTRKVSVSVGNIDYTSTTGYRIQYGTGIVSRKLRVYYFI